MLLMLRKLVAQHHHTFAIETQKLHQHGDCKSRIRQQQQ